MKSQNRIVLYNILSIVIIQGLAFFTTPIFSRIMGPNNFGVFSLYTTWVSLVVIVMGLQTDSTGGIARITYSEQHLDRYYSSILFLSLSSFFVGGLLVLIFIEPVSRFLGMPKAMIVFLLIHAYGSFCITFLTTKFTFEFKANVNLKMSISLSLSNIIISLVLIQFLPEKQNYWGRILPMAVIYGLFGIGISWYIFKKGKTFFSLEYWKFCLPLSLPLIIHALSCIVMAQSDRIMLQHMDSLVAVGQYSLVATFGGIISVIWQAFNNSWSPFLYEYIKKGELEAIKTHGRNYLELFSVLSIGFMLLAPEVFHVFAGREYWGTTNLIPLFVMGCYFVFFYSFPVAYEFFEKKNRIVAWGTSSACLVNIILNLFFIHLWGIFGAAFATMLSHIFQYLFHHFAVKHCCKKYVYPFTLKVMLPYGIAVGTVAICMHLLSISWVIRWGIGCILGLFELNKIIKRKTIF